MIVDDSYAKRLLRSEMTRQGLSYADLVRLLEGAGVKKTEANLRNSVSQGSFTATFFFECMFVMGVKPLHLD